tara:strand:+ start:212 stop:2260 length:2049 start_codon:yes stop_codon:yes gene_type:complete
MSLNIQTVANKCEYTNEFSNGFVVPTNAQAALTKCNMVVPVFIQNIIRVPLLPAGIPGGATPTRADIALYAVIDGIIEEISWTDLYTAHTQYDNGATIEAGLTANEYFSGAYEYWTNNKIYFHTSPANLANDGDKASFSWVLAKAIQNKFSFYRITDISVWKSQSIGIGQASAGSSQISITGTGGHIYNNCSIHCCNQNIIKFNVTYNPFAVTDLTALPQSPANTDATNFTQAADTLTATGLGDAMAVGNGFNMDINGGWIRCKPNWLGDTLRWGLSLAGRGITGDDLAHSALLAALNVVDIGIEWKSATEYQIIDGVNETTLYNGATISVVATQRYTTAAAINKYDNNQDYFFIRVQRGNATTEFVFTIFQGDTSSINMWDNVRPIHECSVTLNSNNTLPTMIATSTGAGLNELTELYYIAEQQDTEIQRKQMSLYNTGGRNAVSIQPNQDFLDGSIRNFWSAIGIHSYNITNAADRDLIDPTLDDLDSNFIISYKGTTLNKTIEWKTNYKDEDDTGTNVSAYWVGKDNVADFYSFTSVIVPNAWSLNYNELLEELPTELSVYLLNMDIKNYSGSFYALTNTQTQTGQTRLISTIPFAIEDKQISQDAIIQYETFNAYYRPINNPEPFITNQLQVEISFKDQTTDKRKIISNIVGLVRAEFNFRSGNKVKSTPKSGLLGMF